MSTSSTLMAVAQALALLNTLVAASANNERLRAMVANAASQGRPLNQDELDELRADAQGKIDQLGGMINDS